MMELVEGAEPGGCLKSFLAEEAHPRRQREIDYVLISAIRRM